MTVHLRILFQNVLLLLSMLSLSFYKLPSSDEQNRFRKNKTKSKDNKSRSNSCETKLGVESVTSFAHNFF